MKRYLLGMTVLMLAFTACGGDDAPVSPDPQKPTQEETPAITIDSSVTTSGLSFTSASGEKSITFTASDSWTLSMAATRNGSSWCTASQTSGGKGTFTITFTVTPNDTYDDRSVSVTLKCGTTTKTFTATQKATDALLLTTDKYELDQEGGTIEVEVKANIDYQMEIAASAKGWITEATTRGLTARTYKFSIAANEEREQREGEIHFKSGDKLETVKVYQSGAEPMLMLGRKEITVSDKGETISVDLKCNVEFDVQMPAVDWIAEAATRGMSSHTLKFTVQPNTDYDSRTAQIIFYEKNGTLKDTLTVTQAQKDAIVLAQKELVIESKGGVLTVKMNTNVEVATTIPDSCAAWISQADTRSLVERNITFSIAENSSYDTRTGSITFSANGLSETVTIVQASASALMLGQKEIIVSDKGETIAVDLTSNGDFDIQMPSVDWITKATTRGLTTSVVKFTVQPNTDYDSRTAQIIFVEKRGSLRDTLTVTQAQKDAIVLAEKELTMEAEGGTLTVKLNTNVDVTTTIPDSCAAWITLPATRGLVERNINLVIAKNNGDDSRTGSVTFSANELTETVTITQRQHSYSDEVQVITVPEPGALKNISLGAYGSIKLIGDLNGTDIKAIREWASTSRNLLDLSEAHIVSGGEAYYSNFFTSSKQVGFYMFYECKFKEIILPACTILSKAFWNCTKLERVTFMGSASYIYIYDYAFSGCSSLTALDLPYGTKSIATHAFENCSNLKRLTIPSTVTAINDDILEGCDKLSELYSHIQNPTNVTFGLSQYNATLYVPQGTKETYRNLYDWKSFKEIKEMDDYTVVNVPKPGKLSFELDTYSRIKIIGNLNGTDIKFIHKWAEKERELLDLSEANIVAGGSSYRNELYTENNVIGTYMFLDCRFESIILPYSLISIGKGAFYGCRSLTSITISNSVTSIGEGAFKGCSSLTSITIPNSVTSIGEYAFKGCSSLTSITIPNSVTSIGEYAFDSCKSLTSITISNSVTSIGWGAFSGCNSLSIVNCYAITPPKLDSYTFSGIAKNATLYVPKGCKAAYMNDKKWSYFFADIVEMTN